MSKLTLIANELKYLYLVYKHLNKKEQPFFDNYYIHEFQKHIHIIDELFEYFENQEEKLTKNQLQKLKVYQNKADNLCVYFLNIRDKFVYYN